jgi:hypothetical protein
MIEKFSFCLQAGQFYLPGMENERRWMSLLPSRHQRLGMDARPVAFVTRQPVAWILSIERTIRWSRVVLASTEAAAMLSDWLSPLGIIWCGFCNPGQWM